MVYTTILAYLRPWKAPELNVLDISNMCILAVMMVTTASLMPARSNDDSFYDSHSVFMCCLLGLLGLITACLYAYGMLAFSSQIKTLTPGEVRRSSYTDIMDALVP